ncbi:DUF2953 domain-containing protein [Suilimivivens aceti]|uniref:DUF2953 domain-containing protein n=1 Tax=Suilimivivens aceti TaxID=2981774 RepID=A0ABT2SZL7_9FIRM|nr:DUF2953 domain-containing protein [Suilimivivens aceti]MCU6743405.1 DUF2953 domain-containing protein [Suilimivivens aceti]SCH17807.1 Uncharacterised protein [uncultured Clostridium sp.]
MGIKILTVLLLILKILGIVLLVLLGILLAFLLIVLFVPVRYQGSGYREEGDPVPVHVQLKVTWLLHLVRVSFIYPEEAFLKVKVLFFQILPAKEKKKKASNKKEADGKKPKTDKKEVGSDVSDTTSDQKISDEGNAADEDGGDDRRTLLDFVRKLFSAIRNIKYTIRKIYDKINHIIHNIRYYIKILQTESFKRAFVLCREQLLRLMKIVLPRKVSGTFTIGMEDPAATGQILSIYGILYPLIGDSITVIPDFEKPVMEGSFRFKGKITAFTLIRIAAKIYFDKDLKRVICLFKKEAVQNGRK